MFEILSDVEDVDYPQAVNRQARGNYEAIRRSLQNLMPGSDYIHFFGSRIMGVASVDSDLDIFVEMSKLQHNFFLICRSNLQLKLWPIIYLFIFSGNSFYESLSSDWVEYYIAQMEEALSYDNNWQHLNTIHNTRVPCIRAFYRPHNLMCDIVFNNGLGVVNSELMEHLFSIQPEAAKFCIFLKKWFDYDDLTVKNYIAVLFGVFYLQHCNYLPSIETVFQRSYQMGNHVEIDGEK